MVGVTLRTEFERKEKAGTAKPLLFVVLDELNKYAPREGTSPIKEVLLDIAERGRSLGVVLIGAQQTASEVERRIVANSAIRVVGRLDAGRGVPPGVRLPAAGAARPGADRQAGHDVRRPAGDPGAAGRGVPVPGLGDPAVRGRRGAERDAAVDHPVGRPVRRGRARPELAGARSGATGASLSDDDIPF